ncbi:MAG TPA: hypothetical protein VMU62_03875 [Acidobacteriaceae bacterium]|nr:hypothetical protein [Acidobacteriaceae bacterium]
MQILFASIEYLMRDTRRHCKALMCDKSMFASIDLEDRLAGKNKEKLA